MAKESNPAITVCKTAAYSAGPPSMVENAGIEPATATLQKSPATSAVFPVITEGFEPSTYAVSGRCTTTVLRDCGLGNGCCPRVTRLKAWDSTVKLCP